MEPQQHNATGASPSFCRRCACGPASMVCITQQARTLRNLASPGWHAVLYSSLCRTTRLSGSLMLHSALSYGLALPGGSLAGT